MEKKDLLSELLISDILSIDFKLAINSIVIAFISGKDGRSFFMNLNNVVYFKLLKAPYEDDDLCFVGDIKIDLLKDGGKEILTKLEYGYLDNKGELSKFKKGEGAYVHIEGDLWLDIVCESFEISEETKQT